MISRRRMLQGLCAGGAVVGVSACASLPQPPSSARVVVVGGGYAGATAAKYLRLLSDHAIDVILIEPKPQFISPAMSNLVIAGELQLSDITCSYRDLQRRHGVRLVRDQVVSIDTERHTVALAHGDSIRYDRLVLAPGIEVLLDAVDGLAQASAAGRIVQAWSAGSETVALNRQLLAMRDGGVFVITIPEAPYRCPPAPYERASLVAAFLQRYKPASKVLVLDANADVTAMGSLFRQAWADQYENLLEYRNHYNAVAVDARSLTVRFDVQEDVQADVLNVLPPVRAGALAVQAGLANINARWCEVDYLSFASTRARHVHVIGDSIQAAPMMPKSGHMANAQAKVAAAAIVAELMQQPIDPQPMLTNTCFSFVNAHEAIHSAAVYEYVAAAASFRPVHAAGGTSAGPSALEGSYALSWAHNIWADMLL
jgi:NADPH-dependent 2,4-dienoyl-CoA reductase/sulfur reductase-like enzyme